MLKTLAIRSTHFAGLGILTLLLTSCGQESEKDSQLKIYGGEKSHSEDWRSTVGIVGEDGKIFCSGTAVHPRLIITAAHCVQSEPETMRVYSGEGVEGGKVEPQFKVEKVAASPNYHYSPEGYNDIAYIVIDEELKLPSDAYIPILTNGEEIKELLAVGVDAHIVGFGGRDDGGYGVKYEVAAPITSLNVNEVAIGTGGKDSCAGDSGGPAFGKLANGEWRVYGIVSRGGSCGNGGIWGLMHSNICWVEEQSGFTLGLPAGFCADKGADQTEQENQVDIEAAK